MRLNKCAEPGCRTTVPYPQAKCGEHRREQRGGSTARGYDATWQNLRIVVLQRDLYLCQECKRKGKLTGLNPSSPVDHIAPLRTSPRRRLDSSNLEALCTACHDAKTKRGE